MRCVDVDGRKCGGGKCGRKTLGGNSLPFTLHRSLIRHPGIYCTLINLSRQIYAPQCRRTGYNIALHLFILAVANLALTFALQLNTPVSDRSKSNNDRVYKNIAKDSITFRISFDLLTVLKFTAQAVCAHAIFTMWWLSSTTLLSNSRKKQDNECSPYSGIFPLTGVTIEMNEKNRARIF